MDPLNEYRMTRPNMYRNPGCPGHRDVTARQGHYIYAVNEEDAHRQMRAEWPNDSHFDLQLVRPGADAAKKSEVTFTADVLVTLPAEDRPGEPMTEEMARQIIGQALRILGTIRGSSVGKVTRVE